MNVILSWLWSFLASLLTFGVCQQSLFCIYDSSAYGIVVSFGKRILFSDAISRLAEAMFWSFQLLFYSTLLLNRMTENFGA